MVTALAAGWRLVLVTALVVAAGALAGALSGEDVEPREAAVDAILPVGAWLVGAAVGWVILATLEDDLPRMLREYPSHAALGAAVLGGTLAVVVLVLRLARSER